MQLQTSGCSAVCKCTLNMSRTEALRASLTSAREPHCAQARAHAWVAGGSVRRDSLEGWPASPQAAEAPGPSASPFAAQHLAGATAAAAAQPFLRLRLATGPARGSEPSQDSHEPADDAAAALRGDWRGSPGGSEQGAEPCHGQGEDASGGASRRGSGSNAGSGWSGDTSGGLESLVETAKVLRVWVEPAALALRPACLMRLGSVLGGRPDSGAESLGTLALQAANKLASRAARAAAKAQLVLKPDAALALDVQARCPWDCVLGGSSQVSGQPCGASSEGCLYYYREGDCPSSA